MMRAVVEARLSIHARRPTAASVSVETTASGEEEQVAEVLLFCLYAAHWIDRLNRAHRGRGINSGVDLALVLRVSEDEELLMDPLVWFFDDEAPLVELVPTDASARKTLSAELHYSDSRTPGSIHFSVNTSGFGLLQRGLHELGGYAENSVLVLQRHLLFQRQQDHPYTIRLWWAGHALGADAINRGVRPIESAVEAVRLGWEAPGRVGYVRTETPP